MTVLTIFTTFVEKNYIMFAVQKDEAGVVSILILIIIVIVEYFCCTEGPIGTELLKNDILKRLEAHLLSAVEFEIWNVCCAVRLIFFLLCHVGGLVSKT